MKSGMKKNLTLNETVREAIALALIQLMHKKPFSQISISEIARVAGVNRSSIYRNFNCKEQILDDYITTLYHNYFHEENVVLRFSEHADIQQFLVPRFRFIKQNRDFFTVLQKNGLLYAIFERMKPELILMLSGRDSSMSPYYLAMFSGAYAGTVRQWIENDFKETEEEMAAIFAAPPK